MQITHYIPKKKKSYQKRGELVNLHHVGYQFGMDPLLIFSREVTQDGWRAQRYISASSLKTALLRRILN